MKDRISAVVLSAGKGLRMGGDVPKQYLTVMDRPLIYYTLKAFEDHDDIDEIILVTSIEYRDYCVKDIVEAYGLGKVTKVILGGSERYDSVQAGLNACTGDYVLIHDGARAFVTPDIIDRCIRSVKKYGACVAGMPAKDTITILDDLGYVQETPPRRHMWIAQTPQCFRTDIARDAYNAYIDEGKSGATDDAAVVKLMMDIPVKYIEGSYENIKVTTREDLLLGEQILKNRR